MNERAKGKKPENKAKAAADVAQTWKPYYIIYIFISPTPQMALLPFLPLLLFMLKSVKNATQYPIFYIF